MDLLDELLAALATRKLVERLEEFSRLDLLTIDELGYLPMDKPGPASASNWSAAAVKRHQWW
jgi:DNA replication protein DnaC